MKRLTDILLSMALIVPTALILLIAAAVVKADSPGPAFFWQRRVGRNRCFFWILKLRTMHIGTPDLASHEVGASMITRSGAWLRRTKIDELPQIWSVLKGDMSFVGPRPCLPVQKELIAERARRDVFRVRPGITGPAQIARIDMSSPRKLAIVDAEYINCRSWLYDLRLIFMTVIGRGAGDAARRGG